MMRGCRLPVAAGYAVLVVALTVPATVAAQESATRQLAQQLTNLLDQRKLDSIAAKDPAAADRYVAALYIAGSQLLVVGAKYSAPTLLNEKILQKNYREVYIDLNAASSPGSKVLVEDLQANGLRPDRDDDEPFDVYTKDGAKQVSFDGEWRKHKMSEDEYRQTFADAEDQYARMLELLIGELKKTDVQ